MGEPVDERYATVREHLGVRERVTALEGSQISIQATLDRIETRQLAPAPASYANNELAGIAAALHRAIDDRKPGSGVGVGTMILIGFGMFGVSVTAFLIGKVFF